MDVIGRNLEVQRTGEYVERPCILERRTQLGYRIPELDYLPVYIIVILGMMLVTIAGLSMGVHFLRKKIYEMERNGV